MATIPRFLLPRCGRIWQPTCPSGSARYASSTTKSSKPSKPIVLEKPARFNPPSHGARLPKKNAGSRHYGGDLSTAEFEAQKLKSYPGMMAPKGTWEYKFWNDPKIHMVITLGTLASIGIYTAVANFKANSPYVDMLPEASDFFSRPFRTIGAVVEVVRLTEAHRSNEVAEKRARKVDDVAKRRMYREAHGIEATGLGGITAGKADDDDTGLRNPALAHRIDPAAGTDKESKTLPGM